MCTPTRIDSRLAVWGRGLDAGQGAVVAALARNRPLLVVEGAAGAGKTATLAATRALLMRQGQELMVVSPTSEGAKVAGAEVGAPAVPAAWLAYQHGWRWSDGSWTRLTVGQMDPPRTGRAYPGPAVPARLRPGGLLIVDEAGMLDQQVWERGTLLAAQQAAASVTFADVPMRQIRPSHVQQWI